MMSRLQRLDDSLLVRRRHSGEHVRAFDCLGQLVVRESLDVRA
jgi:hypothetical protein